MNLVDSCGYPRISYKKFCEEPNQLKHAVEKSSGKTILPNSNTYLKIKDYQPSLIINRNEDQISRLSEFELEAIINALEPHQDVTNFFGYSPKDWQ